MNELMRQAARMQRKIEQTKQELSEKEISSSVLDGKITVTVTLGRKLKQIQVEPAFLAQEGFELTMDAVCTAVNSALEQADKTMNQEITKVTGVNPSAAGMGGLL